MNTQNSAEPQMSSFESSKGKKPGMRNRDDTFESWADRYSTPTSSLRRWTTQTLSHSFHYARSMLTSSHVEYRWLPLYFFWNRREGFRDGSAASAGVDGLMILSRVI